MSLVDMWRPRGRRRFNQDQARAAVEAAQGEAVGLRLKLAAADALIARQYAEIQGLRSDLGAFEAAQADLQDAYAALDRRYRERGLLLTEATQRIANLTSTSLRAPMDAHPEVYGEATVPTDVTTLRQKFAVVPTGGEAA